MRFTSVSAPLPRPGRKHTNGPGDIRGTRVKKKTYETGYLKNKIPLNKRATPLNLKTRLLN